MLTYLNAETFTWGENIKMGISKSKLKLLIRDYVETKYPDSIAQYRDDLQRVKLEKINKYKDIIFLDGDLMWQDDINTKTLKLSTLEAKIYCRNLRHASKKDWRLPTFNELMRLVDYFRVNPAVLDDLEYTASGKYWTITPDVKDISANWYIDFMHGETKPSLRERKYHVRCVRDVSQKEDEF